MGVLCATAEKNALLKKKEDKSTAVKLKASDYVGLPNNLITDGQTARLLTSVSIMPSLPRPTSSVSIPAIIKLMEIASLTEQQSSTVKFSC